MEHLFLYHNGTRGDVVVSRTLYRAVMATGRFAVTLAVCRGDQELVSDLIASPEQIRVSRFRNTPHGSPLDLAALCPAGAIPIEIWLGGDETLPTYQWCDAVAALHRTLADHGIEVAIADPEADAPLPDLGADVRMPTVRRPSIYLDNSRTADADCWFVYDLERLAIAFPAHDLLCTAPVPRGCRNLVDVSGLSWPQRAAISEQCQALVGSTRDPFVLTLTERNRWRPRAICGYDARVMPVAWDYPGNPAELLATMDELVDFLLANVADEVLA